jgi:hypothetical protein
VTVDRTDVAEALWCQLSEAGLGAREPDRWRLLSGLRTRAASTEGVMRQVLWQRFVRLGQETLDRLSAVAGSEPAERSALASAVQKQRSDLAGLLAPLEQASDGSHVLKAVEGLRDTWAKRDMETRVSVAIETLPDDCGPLNSRALVTRSLKAMEELSPAYLERFVNYVDTLLWLQAAASRGARTESPEAGRKPAKTPARPRGRGGR